MRFKTVAFVGGTRRGGIPAALSAKQAHSQWAQPQGSVTISGGAVSLFFLLALAEPRRARMRIGVNLVNRMGLKGKWLA